MLNGKRLSIVSGCKNRESFFLQTLPSWLTIEEIDEVVVVDWSSTVSLTTTLRNYLEASGSRLIIVEALEQPLWHLSKCLNLGFQVSTGEVILRLDGDVMLSRGFFAQNPVVSGHFRAGEDLNSRSFPLGLWGCMLAFKNDVLLANGYNERMIGYGWDDEDLFQSISGKGVIRDRMVYDHLRHLDHDESLRLGTQKETIKESMERNYAIMRQSPWTTTDRMTSWSMCRTGSVVTCIELANSRSVSQVVR